MDGTNGFENVVEEASIESFPASDAPAWTTVTGVGAPRPLTESPDLRQAEESEEFMNTDEKVPGGLHILLVEDHPDTADSAATILRLHGHQVRIAPDGASALLAAEADPPDVVLLDIGLPGMDGNEVAKRMREQPMKKRPLIIALTGQHLKEERMRSYNVGIDLHLTKPVDASEVQRILEHYQKVTTPPKPTQS